MRYLTYMGSNCSKYELTERERERERKKTRQDESIFGYCFEYLTYYTLSFSFFLTPIGMRVLSRRRRRSSNNFFCQGGQDLLPSILLGIIHIHIHIMPGVRDGSRTSRVCTASQLISANLIR